MSTRANIIVKDDTSEVIFYRHSDGYPKGTLPTLNLFLQWVKDGKIRNNVSQTAGWLVILGAIEYNSIPKFKSEPYTRYEGTKMERIDYDNDLNSIEITDWKCGAYEPTDAMAGDAEYLYTVDIFKQEIKVQHSRCNYETGQFIYTPVSKSELAV